MEFGAPVVPFTSHGPPLRDTNTVSRCSHQQLELTTR